MTELLAVTCSTVPDAGETMPSAERRKTVYNATWSVYFGQIEEIFKNSFRSSKKYYKHIMFTIPHKIILGVLKNTRRI